MEPLQWEPAPAHSVLSRLLWFHNVPCNACCRKMANFISYHSAHNAVDKSRLLNSSNEVSLTCVATTGPLAFVSHISTRDDNMHIRDERATSARFAQVISGYHSGSANFCRQVFRNSPLDVNHQFLSTTLSTTISTTTHANT